MIRKKSRAGGLIVICTLAISACSIQLPDHSETSTLPQKYEATAEKFRHRIELANQSLLQKGVILRDANLAPYIEDLGRRLRPEELEGDIRLSFHVLRAPSPNAMALDSGDIYINLGMIALAENEAQLASILAHEQAHVINRHGLENWITTTNTVRGTHIADLFLMGTGISYLAAMAELASYSREQEEEADIEGVQYLRGAGYSIGEAAAVFRLANDLPIKQDKGGIYASHPDNKRRISYLEKVEKSTEFSDAKVNSKRFSSLRELALERSMALMMNSHSYVMAEHFLGLNGEDGAYKHTRDVFRADIMRRQAKYPRMTAKDIANSKGRRPKSKDYSIAVSAVEQRRNSAIDLYRQVIDACSDCAGAFRGIGLAMYDNRRKEDAERYLRKYLELNPQAHDRKYIERIINN